MTEDLNQLFKNISYKFKNIKLVEEALTHPSFSKDKSVSNYQRLEFLGDTVLSMIIAKILMENYPKENEGQLSKRQAHLVCGDVIADIARKVDLGKFMKLSRGEIASGGRENKRNLENAMEALIGAIYMDSGLSACQKLVDKFWGDIIFKNIIPQDPVSSLQEIVQFKTKALPKYQISRTGGDEHKPIFTAIVEIDGIKYAANGNSKKEAQKNVATCVLEMMEKPKS